MIHNETYAPCGEKLENKDSQSLFYTSQFPVDCGNSRSTGDIKEAENHQRISICGSKSKAA